MAIYHFSAKVISRADGRSAVAAAAYRVGRRSCTTSGSAGRTTSPTRPGVIHSEILLPDGAPARLLDRATLWNEVEAGEKRKDAQLAREIEIALPRELTQARRSGWRRISCASSSWRRAWWRTSTCIGAARRTARTSRTRMSC